MHRILVLITLSESGIYIIKANPDIQKAEMEFVAKWKAEGLLESFFISVSKEQAVLIFQNLNESQTTELIETLPYFPYMAGISYHDMNKQF